MSTLKTTNLQHPSAASPAIVLSSDGDATYSGVHDFSAATVTGAPQGLVHINTTYFSAVSAVNLNNVFSSDYDNYAVLFNTDLAGGADPTFRYRVGGVDDSGSNYVEQFTRTLNNVFLGGLRTVNAATLSVTGGANNVFVATFFKPFIASPTQHLISTGSQAGIASLTGRHTVSTSYDGLSIITASETMTGAIRV